MCDLCDKDTRESALRHARHLSVRLHRLAAFYEQVGSGNIKPHTDEFKNQESTAMALVRDLVNDWV